VNFTFYLVSGGMAGPGLMRFESLPNLLLHNIFSAYWLYIFRHYERNNSKQSFSTFSDLVEAILSIAEDSAGHMQYNEETTSSFPMSTQPQKPLMTPIQQIKRLEESRKCKKCNLEDACVVFIPCGHLICCVSCSDRAKRCPVCKEMIKERVRSYIS